MSAIPKRPLAGLAGIVLAASLVLPTAIESACAAEPQSPDQIIRALMPPVGATRSLTTSPADATRAEDARFVDTLRKRATRSFTTAERDKITAIAQKRPSIDLEINFEYNSNRISPKAMPQVSALGQALASADLKDGTFIVAGHTDGKGGESFNQGLSERRADAVKRFLMEKYKIDDGRLVTVGYGKTQLKDPSNPTAAENRRVQVVNVAD